MDPDNNKIIEECRRLEIVDLLKDIPVSYLYPYSKEIEIICNADDEKQKNKVIAVLMGKVKRDYLNDPNKKRRNSSRV